MNDLSKLALIIAGVIGFFLYINLICVVIAWWSGWRTLAARFRHEFDPRCQVGSWQSARMRAGCHYNNALKIAAAEEGFYLATVPIVLQHPSMLIPWNEIKVVKQSRFFVWTFITLQLGNFEQIPFAISDKLFAAIDQKHHLDAPAVTLS